MFQGADDLLAYVKDEGVEFIIDITESKLAEEKLRESEERFRTIADSSPVMIWVTDDTGRIVETSIDGAARTVAGSRPGFADGSGGDARTGERSAAAGGSLPLCRARSPVIRCRRP